MTRAPKSVGSAQVEQAREQAEARVADLLASTSWKITAPLRGVSSLFGAGPTRRRPAGLVAGMGQGPSGAKGPRAHRRIRSRPRSGPATGWAGRRPDYCFCAARPVSLAVHALLRRP